MPLLKMNNSDYIKILEYYKQQIPAKTSHIKRDAEKIMATKLCKCIKKVDAKNESRSIAICSNAIFGRKGLKRGTFKCVKKQMVSMTRKSKRK